MAQVHTHYDNLKVARNAPPEVIRAAYKSLSQKYHPDRNPGNADAMRIIKIINSAYEVLSDPLKRQEHDQWILRMETESQHSFTEFGTGSSANMNQEVRRHRTRVPIRRSRRRHPLSITRAVEKVRALLERFSKHFFHKA
jgi:DnaJ-class molecular chaperone